MFSSCLECISLGRVLERMIVKIVFKSFVLTAEMVTQQILNNVSHFLYLTFKSEDIITIELLILPVSKRISSITLIRRFLVVKVLQAEDIPLIIICIYNIDIYSISNSGIPWNYILLFVVHVCKFESNGLNICWKLELFVCRDARHVKHEKKQSCRGLKCWKQVSQAPFNWVDSV